MQGSSSHDIDCIIGIVVSDSSSKQTKRLGLVAGLLQVAQDPCFGAANERDKQIGAEQVSLYSGLEFI